MNYYDIIVAGGGPAGMMAAIAAAGSGKKVLLLERNEKLGKKLYITGKGRCNITNDAEMSDFYSHIVKNPKFLRSALSRLDNRDLISFMNERGLKTKVERGGRVFPLSDRSSDVINVLVKEVERRGVVCRLNCRIVSISKRTSVFEVNTAKKSYEAGKIIIATGGLSYPSTGSTGDGYRIAEALGHEIENTRPSLVPLRSNDRVCSELQGVSLKNVRISIVQNGKAYLSDIGEMLFTESGISGPLVLTASCYMDDPKTADTFCYLDLKPALDEKTLDLRILRDFDEAKNKSLRNGISKLLINSLIQPVLTASGVDPEKKVNEITKEERKSILKTVKAFRINIDSFAGYNEAVITRGGVNVKEIDPKTMESKKVPGLYFAGEVIDVDAETGGYNLQIAFSTGFAAGIAASEQV